MTADAKAETIRPPIQALLDNNFKMEVDGFLTKSISFITEEYIPKKLRDKDYLQ